MKDAHTHTHVYLGVTTSSSSCARFKSSEREWDEIEEKKEKSIMSSLVGDERNSLDW